MYFLISCYSTYFQTSFFPSSYPPTGEELFNILYYSYKSDTRLTSAAAEQTILKLSNLLGERILTQKIKNLDRPDLDQAFSSIIKSPNLIKNVESQKMKGFGEGGNNSMLGYDPFESNVNRTVTSSVPVSVFDLRKKP